MEIIPLICPMKAGRMKTAANGRNCTHVNKCFDENFFKEYLTMIDKTSAPCPYCKNNLTAAELCRRPTGPKIEAVQMKGGSWTPWDGPVELPEVQLELFGGLGYAQTPTTKFEGPEYERVFYIGEVQQSLDIESLGRVMNSVKIFDVGREPRSPIPRLSDKMPIYLAKSLSLTNQCNVTGLSLANHSITADGVMALAGAFLQMPYLREFYIQGNKIGGRGFLTILSKATNLAHLNFEDTGLNDDTLSMAARTLLPRLTNLEYLNLGGSKEITDDGAVQVCKALMKLPRLACLSLNHCAIGDKGALHIAKLLDTAPGLLAVHLDGNLITARGGEYLLHGVHSSKSIVLVSLHYNPGTSDPIFSLIQRLLVEKEAVRDGGEVQAGGRVHVWKSSGMFKAYVRCVACGKNFQGLSQKRGCQCVHCCLVIHSGCMEAQRANCHGVELRRERGRTFGGQNARDFFTSAHLQLVGAPSYQRSLIGLEFLNAEHMGLVEPLAVKFYKSSQPSTSIILYCPSEAEDIGQADAWLQKLVQSTGLSAVTFDYPGWGFSKLPEGHAPNEGILSQAFEAVYDAVVSLSVSANRMVVVGHGMGSGPAVQAVSSGGRMFQCLILLDPYIDSCASKSGKLWNVAKRSGRVTCPSMTLFPEHGTYNPAERFQLKWGGRIETKQLFGTTTSTLLNSCLEDLNNNDILNFIRSCPPPLASNPAAAQLRAQRGFVITGRNHEFTDGKTKNPLCMLCAEKIHGAGMICSCGYTVHKRCKDHRIPDCKELAKQEARREFSQSRTTDSWLCDCRTTIPFTFADLPKPQRTLICPICGKIEAKVTFEGRTETLTLARRRYNDIRSQLQRLAPDRTISLIKTTSGKKLGNDLDVEELARAVELVLELKTIPLVESGPPRQSRSLPPAAAPDCNHPAVSRSMRLVAACCQREFCCRRCHAECSDHKLAAVKFMHCLECHQKGGVGPECTKCHAKLCKYFCKVCTVWSTAPLNFHCATCNACFVGEALSHNCADFEAGSAAGRRLSSLGKLGSGVLSRIKRSGSGGKEKEEESESPGSTGASASPQKASTPPPYAANSQKEAPKSTGPSGGPPAYQSQPNSPPSYGASPAAAKPGEVPGWQLLPAQPGQRPVYYHTETNMAIFVPPFHRWIAGSQQWLSTVDSSLCDTATVIAIYEQLGKESPSAAAPAPAPTTVPATAVAASPASYNYTNFGGISPASTSAKQFNPQYSVPASGGQTASTPTYANFANIKPPTVEPAAAPVLPGWMALDADASGRRLYYHAETNIGLYELPQHQYIAALQMWRHNDGSMITTPALQEFYQRTPTAAPALATVPAPSAPLTSQYANISNIQPPQGQALPPPAANSAPTYASAQPGYPQLTTPPALAEWPVQPPPGSYGQPGAPVYGQQSATQPYGQSYPPAAQPYSQPAYLPAGQPPPYGQPYPAAFSQGPGSQSGSQPGSGVFTQTTKQDYEDL